MEAARSGEPSEPEEARTWPEGARSAPGSPDGSRILRAGRNCWRVARAERASVVVDAAAYFRALAGALERARRSVLVLGWDFDGNVALDPLGDGPAAAPLREYLPALLERTPELELRILIWGLSVVYGQSQSLPPSLNPDWPKHPRLLFRLANDHPMGACHHEKVVCIDDSLAFAGGIDMTALRWDEPTHDPHHPARVDVHGKPYSPMHDVQLAVDGEAAASLAELARSRWREITGEEVEPVSRSPAAGRGDADPWPGLDVHARDVPVGIARTRPAHRDREEIREVERLALDALSAAREQIYVECQYLTANVLGEQLADLLARPGGPEIVLVLRHCYEGWLQRYAMGHNRDRLLRRLAVADREGRLRAYYPVVSDEDGRDHDIDVHSKLYVVDDRVLRIGSANLSNRSMAFDDECDLALEPDDAAGRAALRAVPALLLAEHMGRRRDEVRNAISRHGLAGAVDRLNGTRARRRLVPFEFRDGGPSEPLPGTFLLDPSTDGGRRRPH